MKKIIGFIGRRFKRTDYDTPRGHVTKVEYVPSYEGNRTPRDNSAWKKELGGTNADGAHHMPHSAGGSDGAENISPQDPRQNRYGPYRQSEILEEELVKSGCFVYTTVIEFTSFKRAMPLFRKRIMVVDGEHVIDANLIFANFPNALDPRPDPPSKFYEKGEQAYKEKYGSHGDICDSNSNDDPPCSSVNSYASEKPLESAPANSENFYATSDVSKSKLGWSIGKDRYDGANFDMHVKAESVNSIVSDFSGVEQVGGIAFDKRLQTINSSFTDVCFCDKHNPDIHLQYLPDLADGSRLALRFVSEDGEWYSATIPAYDWEFIPIAEFVLSDNVVVVTECGYTDEEKQLLPEIGEIGTYGRLVIDTIEHARAARQNVDLVVNYHPAFQNTLLGLRLYHADMLFAPRYMLAKQLEDIRHCARMPRYNGEIILGAGEPEPKESTYEYLYQVWFECFRASKILSRLYILAKSSNPNFPENSIPTFSFVICDLLSNINAQLISSNNSLVIKTSGYPTYWLWFDSGGDVPLTSEELSSFFSELIRYVNGANVLAYRALCQTMRLAALFRFVRSRQPETFDSFVRDLPSQKHLPCLPTLKLIQPYSESQ